MVEVSVVIPTYNSAQFLSQALDSVFQQTFEDYEIIVVDDGSTDDTKTVVEKYGHETIYIYQENGGPSKARNRGIRASSGKYIAFLDADDVWLPTKLEKQVALFRYRPELGMVFTEAFRFNQDGIYSRSIKKRERLMKGDVAKNIFLHSGVGTPTVIVRKDVLEKVGLFEEDLLIAEDDNMWVRIAAEFEVELIDEPLAKFRDHQRNLTRDKKKLLEMVQMNFDLLCSRYGQAGERIREILPRKLSQVQFYIGYDNFVGEDYKGARKAFAKAIRYHIWDLRNYQWFVLSALPKNVIRSLRWAKKVLFRRT